MNCATSLATFLVAFATACGAGGDAQTTGNGVISTNLSEISSEVVSASASSGTLLCGPPQALVDACSGKAAGDACSLPALAGKPAVGGTCRTTLDGATIACAPNPSEPPQPFLDACSGKVAGDACSVTAPDGTFAVSGTCRIGIDGVTIGCAPNPPPPAPAQIVACSGKAAGDVCLLPALDGKPALAGTCRTATDGATIACAPNPPVPTQPQIDACSGKAAGDACSLMTFAADSTVNGICRTTIDGTTIACLPTPPPPPQPLVTACSGKSAGDACHVTNPFGNVDQGTCVTAPDQKTILCGRIFTPAPALVDACADLAAGDACAVPSRDGTGTVTGVCTLGPASMGPLACAPPQDLLPDATAACNGLATGATCTLGPDKTVSGTCVTPAAGGASVCVPACSALGGAFD